MVTTEDLQPIIEFNRFSKNFYSVKSEVIHKDFLHRQTLEPPCAVNTAVRMPLLTLIFFIEGFHVQPPNHVLICAINVRIQQIFNP